MSVEIAFRRDEELFARIRKRLRGNASRTVTFGPFDSISASADIVRGDEKSLAGVSDDKWWIAAGLGDEATVDEPWSGFTIRETTILYRSTGWREFDAAAHVLRDPLIAHRTSPFIPANHPSGIGFDELLKDVYPTMRHGEQLLVVAALDLWNGRGTEVMSDFGLRKLVGTLSPSEHWLRVVEGMQILGGER